MTTQKQGETIIAIFEKKIETPKFKGKVTFAGPEPELYQNMQNVIVERLASLTEICKNEGALPIGERCVKEQKWPSEVSYVIGKDGYLLLARCDVPQAGLVINESRLSRNPNQEGGLSTRVVYSRTITPTDLLGTLQEFYEQEPRVRLIEAQFLDLI